MEPGARPGRHSIHTQDILNQGKRNALLFCCYEGCCVTWYVDRNTFRVGKSPLSSSEKPAPPEGCRKNTKMAVQDCTRLKAMRINGSASITSLPCENILQAQLISVVEA